MLNPRDYHEVRKDPGSRPVFTGLIDLGEKAINITYVPNSKKRIYNQDKAILMTNRFDMNLNFNPRQKSDLFIYPEAFSLPFNDFLGVLSHEKYHIRELANMAPKEISALRNMKENREKMFLMKIIEMEINAYQDQINSFNDLNFSKNYKKRTETLRKEYEKAYDLLRNVKNLDQISDETFAGLMLKEELRKHRVQMDAAYKSKNHREKDFLFEWYLF